MKKRAEVRYPARRLSGVVAVLAVGALALLSGCSVPADVAPEAASRVLQDVHVTVGTDGAIRSVESTALFHDPATRDSVAVTTSHAAAKVVDDLPVRLATHYRADKRSGSDLADLDGYSGRVDIVVSIENLTVSPTAITFDNAGRSQTDPGLVGVPLSITASAKLPGTPASAIELDGDRPTNGIVSTTPQGDAVVQWAALLVSPHTGTSTTLELVADVEDFTPPSIHLAIQAGLRTDPSFDAILGSALTSVPDRELALQQRTIALVADVNTILARAGATVTALRDDLRDTSATLGVRAVEQLRESIALQQTTAERLRGELQALQPTLATSISETESAFTDGLHEVIRSMAALLGETTGAPPSLADGVGCATTVRAPEPAHTVYDMFRGLSGLLASYAEANTSCRDEIAVALQRTLGPESPSTDACRTPSLTCSLHQAEATVSDSLRRLLATGQQLADSLDADPIARAVARHAVLATEATAMVNSLGDTAAVASETATAEAIARLPLVIDTIRSEVDALAEVSDTMTTLTETARTALAELDARDAAADGSILGQVRELADRLCSVDSAATDDEVADVERLRAYLTGTACDGTTPLSTPEGFAAPLDHRLTAQVEAWGSVQRALDDAALDSPLARIDAALDSLAEGVTDALAADTGNRDELDAAIATLRAHAAAIRTATDELGAGLTEVKAQHDALGSSILEAFAAAEKATEREISENLAAQIREVSGNARVGRDELLESYNATIRGLSSASESILGDAAQHIDDEQARLTEREARSTESLRPQAELALERIADRTSASTLDITASSELLRLQLTGLLLDLGDRSATVGVLGAIAASAAKADTADYQLARASQDASGHANIRAQDIADVLRRQAQFSASLALEDRLSPFHLDGAPSGAVTRTVYTFGIAGPR